MPAERDRDEGDGLGRIDSPNLYDKRRQKETDKKKKIPLFIRYGRRQKRRHEEGERRRRRHEKTDREGGSKKETELKRQQRDKRRDSDERQGGKETGRDRKET